jgi:hypothetical protein
LFIDFINFFNIPNIIPIITKVIDYFVVIIISISAIQTIIPIIISFIKINKKEEKNKNNNYYIKSFNNSLLLALELESANAILKMGIFVSNATNFATENFMIISNNFNNFMFFVAVLAVRIAINQTLRRYSIGKSQK